VRRLIVNADDFGLTSGVNRGILDAHRGGIVTSATLMACGRQFDEAARLAQQAPKLSVGCHVVLVDGSPVLDTSQVPCLIRSSRQVFRESLVSFSSLALAGRLKQDQIEAEITAQICKLQSAGIRVSHLDTHKHTHMFPVVFKALLNAAKRCGIRAVRNPFEPLLFATAGSWKRQFQLGMLRRYRTGFRRAIAESRLRTPDGCIGIVATGGLTVTAFTDLIRKLPEGTWEFVSHPGYNDGDLSQVRTRLRHSRDKELAILTSDQVKKLILQEKINLISYEEFATSTMRTPEVPTPSTLKQ
jgi:hopanoid biosynthesis associated protein HpnK